MTPAQWFWMADILAKKERNDAERHLALVQSVYRSALNSFIALMGLSMGVKETIEERRTEELKAKKAAIGVEQAKKAAVGPQAEQGQEKGTEEKEAEANAIAPYMPLTAILAGGQEYMQSLLQKHLNGIEQKTSPVKADALNTTIMGSGLNLDDILSDAGPAPTDFNSVEYQTLLKQLGVTVIRDKSTQIEEAEDFVDPDSL